MTTLENLINDTSTNVNSFANMVGVSPQKIRVQLKSKNHLQFAFKHALKLGINRIYGVENGFSIELIIKNNK